MCENTDNGWGWFVDIESNYEQTKRPRQYVSVLKTINEYPEMRSIKEKGEQGKGKKNNIFINLLLGLAICYFTITNIITPKNIPYSVYN